mmetsp:Transcript_54277/g.118956  ORF Transcript_54277/g.118956 Transcript_54277/m.118956 type:complete len:207 (+) Transcript_54277:54-674(+)
MGETHSLYCCSHNPRPTSQPSDKAMLDMDLLLAVQQGDANRAVRALRMGANVETRRPLMLAPQVNHPGASDKLVGLTPLMYACKDGSLSLSQMLITQRANVNAAEEDGWTPLIFAARAEALAVVELLLANNGDPSVCTAEGLRPMEIGDVDFRAQVAKLVEETASRPRKAPASLFADFGDDQQEFSDACHGGLEEIIIQSGRHTSS